MTNVPTDRTEELQEQNPVEQPTEAVVEEVAQTEEAPVETQPETPQETPSEQEDDLVIETNEEEEEEFRVFEVPDTKEGIVERIKDMADHAEQSEKAEIDQLKQAFYRILKEERSKAYQQYLEQGGEAEKYVPEPEPLEEEFKAQMSIVKEKRAKIQEAVERMKEVNLEKKKAIIEQIKALASTPEDANKNYTTFRKLQDEWKEIKPIPIQNSNEIWKNFQFCVEQYYDLLKENNALRDLDFKKNLEQKTRLCEIAEKLVDDPDIINASHQLQQLHQEFREIGPVAKDQREELWTRFKEASTTINKRHAQFFEQLKAKEEENLQKKTALCEEIESIETANLNNFPEWDAVTKKIVEIQQQWKEIGRAPKKMNVKIFERFRAACDNFFNKKAEHFKEQKHVFAENASKKNALCEQAEALKDSTDWNSTTNKLVQLQKEWKEVGPVARKQSNALWERFNAACNYFFEQKKQVLGDQRKEELANLANKKAIIEKLEAIAVEGGSNAAEKVRDLMNEWNAVGHVPFRDKDKIYTKYRDVIDKLFKELDLSSLRKGNLRSHKTGENRNQDNTQNRSNNLYRLYENKKAELATYENNISFLTSHSKSGNALIDNMNRKIDSLKQELLSIAERIKSQELATTEEDSSEEKLAKTPTEATQE